MPAPLLTKRIPEAHCLRCYLVRLYTLGALLNLRKEEGGSTC